MKVTWEDPWASEVCIQRVGDGALRVVECEPGKSLRLALEPGYSYLLRASDPIAGLSSPILQSGPVLRGAEVRINPAPVSLGTIKIRLPAGVSFADTIAQPRDSAHSQVVLSRFEGSGARREGRIFCWPLGRTTLVLGTRAGPFYRTVGIVPPGRAFNPGLGQLGTVEVCDGDGRPVPGAIVELDPLQSRPFTMREMHFPKAMKVGSTDASGRVAVASEDLKERLVRAWAPGFLHGEARAEGPACTVVLERSNLEVVDLDLGAREGEVLDMQMRPAPGPQRTDTPSWERPICGLPCGYAVYREGRILVSSVGKLLFQSSGGASLELPLPVEGKPRWSLNESHFAVVPPADGTERLDCGVHGQYSTQLHRSDGGEWMPTAGVDTEMHLLVSALQNLPVGKLRLPALWKYGPVILQASECYPTVWSHSRKATGTGLPEVIELARIPGKRTTIQVVNAEGEPLGGSRVFLTIAGYGEESRERRRNGEARLATALAICDEKGRAVIYVPARRSLDMHVMHPGYADEALSLAAGASERVILKPAAWLVVETDESWVTLEHEQFSRESDYWARLSFDFNRGALDYSGHCRPYGRGEPIFLGPLPEGQARLRGESGATKTVSLVVGKTTRMRL